MSSLFGVFWLRFVDNSAVVKFCMFQVDLGVTMNVWHAVETLNTTYVVCHVNGVSEVDTEGRVTRVCRYDHFAHPCHIAVVDGGASSISDLFYLILTIE